MSVEATQDEPAIQLPVLEVVCTRCRGRGAFDSRRGESEDCYDCSGSGYIPTDAGEAVLALIRHNLRVSDRGTVSWRD